jgi:hypothetical protein
MHLLAVFTFLCYNYIIKAKETLMNISKQNMKPFFCIDITSDKKNEASNGSEFITRTASKQKVEEFENK